MYNRPITLFVHIRGRQISECQRWPIGVSLKPAETTYEPRRCCRLCAYLPFRLLWSYISVERRNVHHWPTTYSSFAKQL